MKKIFSWLDDNLLAVLAGFLLIFIPLYPKWPLFDILYGYNVRVRLEDFFVLLGVVVFGIQLLRRKISLSRDPVSIGLVIYLIVGFLSVIASIFIVQTVPLEYIHAGKTLLHWMRRIEYLSLFFIFFATVKSFKTIRPYLFLFLITFLAVIIYGYGQKYLYWPAFSTMNREFAKGWWLYLTAHARVLSTFGGHYDLAGYLVIALTLCWSFFFGLKNILAKLGIGLLLAGGFWLLILTASRISFAGYMVGLSVVIFFWMIRKGIGWGISRWLITVFLSIFIMLSFGDLSDRFLQLLKLDKRFGGLRAALLQPASRAPENNAMFLENNIAAVTSKSDQPPTLLKPGDVTGEEMPLLIPEKTASGATILVPKQRTYSKNALLFDLSTGIRLDTTWPRAIAGFKADPLLGSGYATLTKATKYEYTEGESTDNDYLRALGETGFLGFASFFGSILLMVYLTYKSLGGIKDPIFFSLAAGFIGLVAGLLINALTIDIFEASKVAYVFWGVAGLTMGTLYKEREKIRRDMEPFRLVIPWWDYQQRFRGFLISDKFWLGVILVGAFILRLYKYDAPIADWHSWRQADTSAVTRNFERFHAINWFYPTFDDLSSVASGQPNSSGVRFVEYPIYNIFSFIIKNLAVELSIESAGRVTTALMSLLTLTFIFLLCRKYASRRAAYFAAFSYALLPYGLFYGRAILPDPTMVAFALGALWFAPKHIIIGAVFAAIALLVKPFAIFLLLPLLYINKKFVFVLVLAALPLLWWRWWIGQYPAGIPASDWLLNGDGIRFKGAFWYWLFADRIGRLILGYWGLIPFAIGWVKAPRFFKLLLLSSLLYLFVFATGNVRHDYYQILLLPSIAIFLGLGLNYLLSFSKTLMVISFLFMLGFGWYHVRDFYNINHPEIVESGQKVRELTDWRSLVIAPYDGDTAFLYQTDRRGWPIMEGSIEDMIKKGAQYYVSVRFDDLTKTLMVDSWPVWKIQPETNKKVYKYKMLAYTDNYVIIQLVSDNKLPKN